jgi:branched-subunit amino acid aminotransferase/4-amino-4-deoxychorismate lyase
MGILAGMVGGLASGAGAGANAAPHAASAIATTASQTNLIVMLHELPANIWESSSKGIKIITCDFQRDLPEVKTINYAMGIRMLPAVRAAGAQDLVYHDGGWIRESARSNFYIVNTAGAIITPNEQILGGVTRKHILDLARKNGIAVEERAVHLDEIAEATEAFFTSSTKGVMPVTHVDGQQISDGAGPIAQRLQTLFLESVEAYIRVMSDER